MISFSLSIHGVQISSFCNILDSTLTIVVCKSESDLLKHMVYLSILVLQLMLLMVDMQESRGAPVKKPPPDYFL